MITSHNGLTGDFDVQNRIFLDIRPEALEFLESKAVVKRLTQDQVLYEEGELVSHAIFPHEGVVSLMASMEDGRSVAKVSLGKEGFVGIAYILGGGHADSQPVVKVPGYASWISIEALDAAIEKYPCVRDAMMRYARSLTVQLMESVACNSLHKAEQRIARWLLEAHDRVNTDAFQITQNSVSEVLGLRRATVSAVCNALMNKGALSYSRGTVTVAERRLLEDSACECYDRIRREYQHPPVIRTR
ncbi:Crp/Fnr family transcriptional regulator [Hoeflea sp.]|uniref:Crp/Fnr family transcriptional regulator n=1 Tax=Hoeflea sp. TaxID=1940281 RepID=UPI0025BA447D|nr:Crp/Fnr family transcriptional regulator [Hoeflea sp.]